MSPNQYEEKITACVTRILEKSNVELVDIEFVKEGGNWFLRIFIDKDGGVGIDDCEWLSRALDPILDEEDFIEVAYTLEVSSPGLDRPLKKEADFIRYQGRMVDIKLYQPKNGQKKYSGRLEGYDNGIVRIKEADTGEQLTFALKEMGSIRLKVII